MSRRHRNLTMRSVVVFWWMVRSASAFCECVYSVNGSESPSSARFTSLFETDFLHLDTFGSPEKAHYSTGWTPQEYSISPQQARGPFGKAFMLANIKLSPISSEWDYGGPGLYGDPGVQLWVRSRPLVMNNGDTAAGDLDSWQNVSLISGAELSGIARERMQFGSFRVGMKLPDGNGTCAAFFWYHDNSHELDMEYLSKENFYTNSTINLVMHTPETAENGYDARNTTGFTRHILPFPASKGYHDYRFDWLPDRVEFYVDGTWIAAMTGPGVPQSPGYLMLNHWSNGDAGWSGGPPTEDAKMTVSYVKAYFNSTSEEEEQNFTLRCPFADPGEIWRRTCEVPSQTSPPDPQMGNSSGRTYFFVKDPGHAPGQLIFDGPDKTSAAGGYRPRFGLFTAASTTIGATLSYIIGGIVLIL